MFVGCVSDDDDDVRSIGHFWDPEIRRFTLRKPVLEGPKSVKKVGIAIVTQDDCLSNPSISAKWGIES